MTGPDISVVMATQNAADTIEACLNSLRTQSAAARAEVIIADESTDSTARLIEAAFPEVKLLRFEQLKGTPELIRQAMRQARGRVIVLTDPYCVFPPDWLEKLLRAHTGESPVIGGAVENGRAGGIVSWACYFADYGSFMLPLRRQTTRLLAGNHVSYKRAVLEASLDSMPDGFWKVFFHRELGERGVPFLMEPDLVVYYCRRDTAGSFARRYFEHGRFFAGERCRQISPGARVLRCLTAPLLVPVLSARRIGAVLEKRRNIGKLVLASPLIVFFVCAWSAGELLGYWGGSDRLRGAVYQ